MSLIKYIRRLEFVNYLIKKRATGNLDAFARKNNLSKRAMTDFITQLREMGADIRYDRVRKTYYYDKKGEIPNFRFMEYGQVLSREEAALTGDPKNLCFSERAVFIPCEKVED
jgi:predicted DNA-binding transcriptional regulator YafY